MECGHTTRHPPCGPDKSLQAGTDCNRGDTTGVPSAPPPAAGASSAESVIYDSSRARQQRGEVVPSIGLAPETIARSDSGQFRAWRHSRHREIASRLRSSAAHRSLSLRQTVRNGGTCQLITLSVQKSAAHRNAIRKHHENGSILQQQARHLVGKRSELLFLSSAVDAPRARPRKPGVWQ